MASTATCLQQHLARSVRLSSDPIEVFATQQCSFEILDRSDAPCTPRRVHPHEDGAQVRQIASGPEGRVTLQRGHVSSRAGLRASEAKRKGAAKQCVVWHDHSDNLYTVQPAHVEKARIWCDHKSPLDLCKVWCDCTDGPAVIHMLEGWF